MEVAERVAAWEPPHRVVFDGGDGVDGLAFEWLVEARDGGTCVVRLVNTGFGSGDDWDAQYDGMAEGWPLFLLNLRLHREHFAGRQATAALPTATWAGPRDAAWKALVEALGLPAVLDAGHPARARAAGAPALAGAVVEAGATRIALVLDEPARGTAFVAVEGNGDQVSVSIWSYLYGEEGAAAAARDEPRGQRWHDDQPRSVAAG
jgi:hypothetical protein